MEANSLRLFKKGFSDGIPIGIGYVPLMVALGVMAVKIGLGFGISQLMYCLLYSGTGMAAVLNLVSSGEMMVFTYLLTFCIVNCRYVLLSISMSQKLDPKMSTFSRMIFAFFNTDEIFAVAMQQKGFLQTPYLFGISLFPFLASVVGMFLGLVFTNFLPASVSSAFGILLYAMLLALIVPPMRGSRAVSSVILLAAGISTLLECNPFIRRFLSSGWIMIACSVFTALLGAVFFPVDSSNKKEIVNEQ
ncbi:MAG: AzlC family ABC transporter permease [Oscillospiraceae bacterium]|jgi:predicted branched-subunit amino acid permease|nr:AzlC family ABC transporter permease [Oscillospiraceae bacterium]